MSAYTFAFGPVEYVAHRDGTPLTLVECAREVYGVGEARILRDGRPIVTQAGSAYAMTYLPRSRRVVRRKVGS